jgi:hypothetical protein
LQKYCYTIWGTCAFVKNMKNPVKIIFACLAALILGGIIYYVFPVAYLFYSIHSQMKAGQRYMDSITDKDISVWIKRTETYLKEYDANSTTTEAYGLKKEIPVPDELKALKILRIHISRDSVFYVWVGGFDHTYLHVQKTDRGNFRVTGNYDDYSSKVIWPKQEDANEPFHGTTVR